MVDMRRRHKDRVWVEEGTYGEPITASTKSRTETFIAAVLYIPLFIAVSNTILNIYITSVYGTHCPVLSINGLELYIRSVKVYGLHGNLLQIAFVFAAAFCASAILFRLAFFNTTSGKTVNDTHGSSHWASKSEIENAGLLGSDTPGVICGGWHDPKSGEDNFLIHTGPEHILVVAPTRSGKGVSLIIPSLLTWPESVFVLDIKGENFLATGGWREQAIGPVLRFEPTDESGTSARFNPLEEIRFETDHEIGDIQKITQIMVDPDGKSSGAQKHWTDTAAELLTGAIIYELHTADDMNRTPSIDHIRDDLSMGEFNSFLGQWRDYAEAEENIKRENSEALKLLSVIASSMLKKDEREFSGVLSSAKTALTLWNDPVICKNTSDSTFHIGDLVNSTNPVSLYLVIPPSDLIRLVPLLRLFVSQLIYTLTRQMKRKGTRIVSPHEHRLLLMLDEFPQMNRLDVIEKALAQMAGYGLKAYIITQSYTQLTDVYGKDETVSANCGIHICFAPNDLNTAEIISRRTGKTTTITGSSNISGKRWTGLFGKNQENISYTHAERPLLLPDEVMSLTPAKKNSAGQIISPGRVLVFVAGVRPIYAIQTLYFKNPAFSERTAIEPPKDSSDVELLPNAEHTDAADVQKENTVVEDWPVCNDTDSDGDAEQVLQSSSVSDIDSYDPMEDSEDEETY